MTCPPCTHDCREGRDCPLIAINAQVVGYVKPQRQWVGLTDKERFEIRMHSIQNMGGNFQETLCKSIEAKLKQKNGYAEEMNT